MKLNGSDATAILLSQGGAQFRQRLVAARNAVAGIPEGRASSLRTSTEDVALIIATHNDERTIAACILSALNQTVAYREIVVVDDASTDRTPHVVAALRGHFPSLRVHTLRSKAGPAFARNWAIARCSAQFITTLDGDDILWPTKNEEESRLLGGGNEVVFSDIVLEARRGHQRLDTSAYQGPGERALRRLARRSPYIPRDMVIPRSLHTQVGGYDERLRLFEDFDLKMRLAAVPGVVWRYAGPGPGTLYSRIQDDRLSRAPGLSLGRAALHVLCRNIESLRQVDADSDDSIISGLRSVSPDLADAIARITEGDSGALRRCAGTLSSRRTMAIPEKQFLAFLEQMLRGYDWRASR
jgi:glycosyltransferase involved in cell wall biosynthesis